jgi:hypothetical protein
MLITVVTSISEQGAELRQNSRYNKTNFYLLEKLKTSIYNL